MVLDVVVVIRAYVLFVVTFIALPVLFAVLMNKLWQGYNLQFPVKGRMGVWLSTFTLPVRAIKLLAIALVYKGFGRKVKIARIKFPYSILPVYGIAPASGKVYGLLRFSLDSLSLWFLPLMIGLVVLICPNCDVANLHREILNGSCDCGIGEYLLLVARGSLQLLLWLVFDWRGGILKFMGLAYVLVCLSVDFGLNIKMVFAILPGLGVVCGIMAMAFCLPILSDYMVSLLVKALPLVACIQSTIATIIIFGAIVLWCIIGIRKCCASVVRTIVGSVVI